MSTAIAQTDRMYCYIWSYTNDPTKCKFGERWVKAGLDPTKTFLDPSCGDGQFLSEVLIRKMEHGATFEQALSTIYGVELMPDNAALCRDRLLCKQEHLRHIVDKNIVCADGLRYHYRFDGTDPYATETDLRFANLFG